MPFAYSRPRWNNQPTSIFGGIDFSHWAANSLWAAQALDGRDFIDIFRQGVPLNQLNVSSRNIQGRFGNQVGTYNTAFNNGGNPYYYQNGNGTLSASTSVTLLCILVGHGLTAVSVRAGVSTGVAGFPLPGIYEGDGTNNVWRAQFRTASATDVVVNSSITAPVGGTPRVLVARYTNGTGLELFVDGVSAGSTGSALNLSGTPSLVQSSGGLSNQDASPLTLVWRRALSDAEIRELSDNPWQVLRPQDDFFYYSTGGGGSVNLTGQSVTASRGTITPANAVSISGQAVTTARGTLVPALAKTVTGQAITFAAPGTLTPASAVPLTGIATTISQGTLVPSTGVFAALTGLATTISRGTLIPANAVPLTGQAVTVSRGTLVPVIGNVVTLSGQAITVNRGSVQVALAVGLLGQSITTSRGTLTPSTGGNVSVNLTGNSVTLSQGTLTPTLGNPPETIEFSWSKEGAVFTFNKNTVLFEFD